MYRGLDKQCNIQPIITPPKENLENVVSQTLDENNAGDETTNDNMSILKLILEKLGIENQITNEVIDNKNNESHIKNDEKNNKKLFHGPYQPNYGTQINIDHLTLVLDPSMLDKVSF